MKKYHIEFSDPLKHELLIFIEAFGRQELKEKLTRRLLAEYYDIVTFKLHCRYDMLYKIYDIKDSDSLEVKQLKIWRMDKPNYRVISVFVRNSIR